MRAVKQVVEDNVSYRHAASKLSVSPMTVLNWVNDFAKQSKSPIEIAKSISPKWQGILGIDGKPIKVSGTERTLLIAVDIITHDPFYFILAPAEDAESTEKFLKIIKFVFEYPVRGIVSDFGKGKVFKGLVKECFPTVPHQICVLHFSRYVDIKLPKSKKNKYYLQNELLRSIINQILFANNLNEADEIFQRFHLIENNFSARYHKEIIRSLKNNFELLTAHFTVDELPRDSNIVENIIKQLNRKLHQTDGFGNEANLYNFLKLWFCYYRYHTFTCSRYPGRNGQSPLDLAQANITQPDWLKFTLKNSNN